MSWRDVVVAPDTRLGDAIALIDRTGLQAALVADADGTLLGILTDGNVRRAILAGKGIDVPVSAVMNAQPVTAPASMAREEMLALMRRGILHHLPIVDEGNRLVGLVTLDELVGATERPNWVVLMAGGLGTRLQPLTDERPKPLLEIGGKPILETIVQSFAEQGFRRIFLSVNYKAPMIRDHFGSGERWGVRVDYLDEQSPLGTAGALALLPEKPASPILVMNGDLITRTNFENLLQFHTAHAADATMAVREYDFQVPYGVVRLEDSRIRRIDEKPVQRFFVNAGIYVIAPSALNLLSPDQRLDMTTFFERLIEAGRTTVAYPLREYWLDIGRLEEFERAQREWRHPADAEPQA